MSKKTSGSKTKARLSVVPPTSTARSEIDMEQVMRDALRRAQALDASISRLKETAGALEDVHTILAVTRLAAYLQDQGIEPPEDEIGGHESAIFEALDLARRIWWGQGVSDLSTDLTVAAQRLRGADDEVGSEPKAGAR